MSSRNATRRRMLRSVGATVDVTGEPVGPSPEELAAIEDEWPLIAAEIELTDAEIRVLTEPYPTELDWHRVRRAELAVAREALAYAARLAQGGASIGRAA